MSEDQTVFTKVRRTYQPFGWGAQQGDRSTGQQKSPAGSTEGLGHSGVKEADRVRQGRARLGTKEGPVGCNPCLLPTGCSNPLPLERLGHSHTVGHSLTGGSGGRLLQPRSPGGRVADLPPALLTFWFSHRFLTTGSEEGVRALEGENHCGGSVRRLPFFGLPHPDLRVQHPPVPGQAVQSQG